MTKIIQLSLVVCALAVSSNAFGMLVRPFAVVRNKPFQMRPYIIGQSSSDQKHSIRFRDDEITHLEAIHARNTEKINALKKQTTILKKLIGLNNKNVARLTEYKSYENTIKGRNQLKDELQLLEEQIESIS